MKSFADAHVHVKKDNLCDAKKFLDTLYSIGLTHIGLHGLVEMFGSMRNIATLYWKLNYKKIKIYAFGGFHLTDIYKDIPLELQAEKLLDMGFDGIKIIEMKPNIRKKVGFGINSPRYDKMFSVLEERKVPVLIHVGDPEEFWDIEKINPDFIPRGWYYGDGTYLTREELYKETFEMLDKHKDLKVIFAHFFFLASDMQQAQRVLDKYPNVYFDLTPCREMYFIFSKEPAKWHDFFEKNSDRIIFGTDSSDQSDELEQIHNLVDYCLTRGDDPYDMPTKPGFKNRGINVSRETYEKICYKNFINFVGNTPKEVNSSLLTEEIKKFKEDFIKVGNHPEYVAYLQDMLEGMQTKKGCM